MVTVPKEVRAEGGEPLIGQRRHDAANPGARTQNPNPCRRRSPPPRQRWTRRRLPRR